MPEPTIYEQLVAAGVPIDHHESDLYCKVTPESVRILKGVTKSTFVSQVPPGGLWFDVPFRYDPFWKAKTR